MTKAISPIKATTIIAWAMYFKFLSFIVQTCYTELKNRICLISFPGEENVCHVKAYWPPGSLCRTGNLSSASDNVSSLSVCLLSWHPVKIVLIYRRHGTLSQRIAHKSSCMVFCCSRFRCTRK